jgi:predicted metal-dependent HD superfamily phosphohydrolase
VTTRAHLHKSWRELLTPFESPPDVCERVFAELTVRYNSPDRHYHTLEHIEAMLELLPQAALALAVWFHDAVYDTRAADNEERSAALGDEMLQPLYVPPEIQAETRRLILLTKRHDTREDDADGRRLLDADLAILGAAEDEYDRYAKAIRQEYAWVPEDDFRRGRQRVLENFLQRRWIYFTDGMREQREVAARKNLRREIASLG